MLSIPVSVSASTPVLTRQNVDLLFELEGPKHRLIAVLAPGCEYVIHHAVATVKQQQSPTKCCAEPFNYVHVSTPHIVQLRFDSDFTATV